MGEYNQGVQGVVGRGSRECARPRAPREHATTQRAHLFRGYDTCSAPLTKDRGDAIPPGPWAASPDSRILALASSP